MFSSPPRGELLPSCCLWGVTFLTHSTCYLALLLLLTACTDTVEVQRRYVDIRDECRTEAESAMAQFYGDAPPADTRQFNTGLATAFNRCMYSRGWTIATTQPALPATGTGVGVSPGPDVSARRRPEDGVAASAVRPAPVPMISPQQVLPAPVPVPYASPQQEVRKRPKENPLPSRE